MTHEQRLAAFEAQQRENYSADEIAALGAKGQAFKNPNGDWSYPIADESDLKNAIKAVGRGSADHDSIRKYIIQVAKKLDLSELIPDNWNSDGSLSDEEKAAWWDGHRRADDISYGDLCDLLSSAVSEKFASGGDDWCYVLDFTDSWAVFCKNGERFQVTYTLDDNTVTLGDAVPVRTVTTYVPMETKSAGANGQTRENPTPEDAEISWALMQVKKAIATVKALQLSDPDNSTDPDDKAVMGFIEQADTAIEGAIAAQSKDGHEDAPEKKGATVPAVAKRHFWSAIERPVPVELRMEPTEAEPNVAGFVGYASTTGTGYAVTDWLGEYREVIVPGAFGKTLREQKDVPLLFNHDGIPLASTGSGTSRLSEDGQGLRNEATLDRTDGLTNSICVQLRRGVLNKMSFSFRAIKDEWNDHYDERAVTELALFDTSIVTYPANPSTTAELRGQFREALGREGLGVIYSARAALSEYRHKRTLDAGAEPVLEQAVRALAAADEVMCRRTPGPYVRSRTFLVAGLMEHVRKGAVLSAANQTLLASAIDALSVASDSHAQTAQAHQQAADALSQIQAAAGGTGTNDEGTSANQGTATGENPSTTPDGAGPRSLPPTVLAARRRLHELRHF